MATILEEFEDDFDSDEPKEEEDDGEAGVKMEDDSEKDAEETPEELLAKLKDSESVMAVKHLLYSDKLQSLLRKLDDPLYNQKGLNATAAAHDDPSHQLIMECNLLTVEMDNEIAALHRHLVSKYTKKFPELEKLVLNPLDYARTAKRIGNESDLTTVDLSDILPSSMVMVATISGSTSDGVKLTDAELEEVVKACDEMVELDDGKKKIVEYISSRMVFVCPNLTNVVGPEVASRLVGAAGGITKLAKMPSSTVQVLGQAKVAMQGRSTAAVQAHQGFLWEVDVVDTMPPSLRVKTVRVLAGKCTLAARYDCHSDGSGKGDMGKKMHEQVKKKLEQLQAPDKAKMAKPLPAPDDKLSKKRGGKRARAMKDKYATSEMRKMANRMTFNGIDGSDDYDPTGEGLGMLMKGSGKIRMSRKEEKKTSKLLNQNRKVKKFAGSSGATNGLASSLAFTPVQGLELANPMAQTPKPDDKYFGTSTSFFHVPKHPSGRK